MAKEHKHCHREGAEFPIEEFYRNNETGQWIHNRKPLHYITGERVSPKGTGGGGGPEPLPAPPGPDGF